MWSDLEYQQLTAEIQASAVHWGARHVVVDATGLGAGLASSLTRSLPGRVIPFTFSLASKSKLGWDFISLIEAGRLKDWDEEVAYPKVDRLQELFLRQCLACQMDLLPGPEQRVRWSVPDSAKDDLTGAPLHDDLLVSAAMAAILDSLPWGTAKSEVVQALDPLAGFRETV